MSFFHHTKHFGLLRPFCSRHGQAIPMSLSRVSHRYSSYLRVEKEDGYAIMHINKPPVNSYNKALYLEMKDAILDLESDKDMEGVIITSALPKYFTAGIDLKQLIGGGTSEEDVQDYWKVVQDWWLTQYGSRLTTMTAINGHCLAAGTLTALSSDYRIMARGPYMIGLNEAKIDIILPFWMRDILRNTTGYREAEKSFQLGSLYSPEEALRVGMVDELVDEEDLMKRAQEEMATWLEISGNIRHESKMQMRSPLMNQLRERREEDALYVAKEILSERVLKKVQQFLGGNRK